MPEQVYTNTYSRVWFQEGGPGPSRAVGYHGNWKAGSVSWDRGDITNIRVPDPNEYNKFIRVGRYRGEPGDPELPITARYDFQRSILLRAARADCEHGLQVHMGICENPQDQSRGWTKMLILEGAAISSYGTEDLGALSPDENSPVNEDVPFTGSDLYEVTRLKFGEQAGAAVSREITGVHVCDRQQCGACGVASDGCQVVVALEGGVSASPGASPTVIFTTDGGSSWAERSVTTLAANESGSAVTCMGNSVVVLSADSESLHHTDLPDLVLSAETWAEVSTGFVTAHGPLAIWVLGATEAWIVGEGGYVYFCEDPQNGVEVSDAGNASSEDLNDVHAFDSNNIVAVGANNAVVASSNGGANWQGITGPAAGVVLNAVWMHSALEWSVGAANGRLYYTIDGGSTWSEKSFSGSGVGSVRDIVFTTPSVGYMAHSTAAPAGRILRSTNGGSTWYVLPEGAGAIPTNDYVSTLAVCDDPNVVFGGGLGGNAVDGFLVKAA